MEKIIKGIKQINKDKVITFTEDYYKASDNKTVMGEVQLREILFLDYRETEAGSNPREYIGLKKANLNILESLLEDQNMFRILHSGMIVSLVNPNFTNKKSIKYEDCCLTNGNQTRFIILILVLIKLLRKTAELMNITKHEFQSLIEKYFSDNENIVDLMQYVRLKHVNEIVSYLGNSRKYENIFKTLNLNNFLDTRIRVQINLVNAVIEDSDNDLDSYVIGTLIAEANNNTQNVKADDIFGTKNKETLNKKIFKDFKKLYGNVQIEFRLGEIINSKQKVHILTLLRLVVTTGILTNDNDIFKLTNQRIPVYRLFDKLLKRENVDHTISAISKLIPLLYGIRVDYIEPYLQQFRRDFTREYIEKAMVGDLKKTAIASQVDKLKNDEAELEKLIKRSINYNIEHITPVLIFRIRMLFEEQNGKLDLTIPKDNRIGFFKGLIEAIYRKYIEKKLGALPTSLTTVVREKDFYEYGDGTYIAFKNTYKLHETDYIKKNQHIIK